MLLIKSDFLGIRLHGHIFLITIYFQEQGFLKMQDGISLYIRKLKECYCVRRDYQKRTCTETLNCYYTVFQWKKLRLILNLQWIIGLQSQSINFKNEFDQVDITIGEPVLIELTRYLKSDKEQCDVFIRLNKSLYGQV